MEIVPIAYVQILLYIFQNSMNFVLFFVKEDLDSDKLPEFGLCVVVVVVLDAVPDMLDLMFVGLTGAAGRDVTVQVHPQDQ